MHREKVERRTDEASARVEGGGAYLEAGEEDVLCVGPWRALEVNGVGHEGCLGVERELALYESETRGPRN